MSTLGKKQADEIAAGKYAEDGWVRIVEYDNAWGGVSYGCVTDYQDIDTYMRPTDFVKNPRIYWERK